MIEFQKNCFFSCYWCHACRWSCLFEMLPKSFLWLHPTCSIYTLWYLTMKYICQRFWGEFWGEFELNFLLLLFRSNLGMLSKFQSKINRGSLPGNVANLSHLCEVACQCNLQLRRGNVSNACEIHETWISDNIINLAN